LGLANTDDWDKTVAKGSLGLRGHHIVGLTEHTPALGMTDLHISAAQLREHGPTHFTGERSHILPMKILSP
jgi:hypothetical protein